MLAKFRLKYFPSYHRTGDCGTIGIESSSVLRKAMIMGILSKYDIVTVYANITPEMISSSLIARTLRCPSLGMDCR